MKSKKIIRKQLKHNKTKKNIINNKIKRGLYPRINPLKKYKLKVSKLHTIAFSTYGNPNGKPVVYVHGGPGSATSPNSARFFNPKKYYIVIVDQRGCGKSIPTAETRENTTKNLISDFEKIRKFLHIDKWQVFGGSWGSTLSLAYAITHPDRVTELVLRGIYFCSPSEINWLTEEGGAQRFSPEAWEFYENAIPEKNKYKGNYFKAYEKCFKGDYGEKKKDHCLLAWSAWEDSNSKLHPSDFKELVKGLKKDKSYIEMSSIEHHYFKNGCFLEKEYFTKKENLDKIKHIPTTIVQGLYDLECPYETAYKLHKLLPNSKMYSTLAGHSAYDRENAKYLVKTTDYYTEH
jgi:proline iminopeptidase